MRFAVLVALAPLLVASPGSGALGGDAPLVMDLSGGGWGVLHFTTTGSSGLYLEVSHTMLDAKFNVFEAVLHAPDGATISFWGEGFGAHMTDYRVSSNVGLMFSQETSPGSSTTMSGGFPICDACPDGDWTMIVLGGGVLDWSVRVHADHGAAGRSSTGDSAFFVRADNYDSAITARVGNDGALVGGVESFDIHHTLVADFDAGLGAGVLESPSGPQLCSCRFVDLTGPAAQPAGAYSFVLPAAAQAYFILGADIPSDA